MGSTYLGRVAGRLEQVERLVLILELRLHNSPTLEAVPRNFFVTSHGHINRGRKMTAILHLNAFAIWCFSPQKTIYLDNPKDMSLKAQGSSEKDRTTPAVSLVTQNDGQVAESRSKLDPARFKPMEHDWYSICRCGSASCYTELHGSDRGRWRKSVLLLGFSTRSCRSDVDCI
jgi:hypothetical protein